MSCILRASGAEFDVDAFMAKTLLEVDSLWRKGEKRFIKSSNSEINRSSGIRVVASEADFSDLGEQIQHVISFLRKNIEQVKLLASFPGAEGAVLDFGIEIYPPQAGHRLHSRRSCSRLQGKPGSPSACQCIQRTKKGNPTANRARKMFQELFISPLSGSASLLGHSCE